MRLIDADAVKYQMLYKENWMKGTGEEAQGAWKSDIDKMPTIDAVPVKHGEWIDDGGLYRCSSCNHLWSELWWTEICPIERMLKIMPYCPNCGADMRERKDDE